MSAREVIPNWPRGRSTTTSWSNTRHGYTGELAFWPYYTSSEMHIDLLVDAHYHAQQKAMIDRWFENWRGHHFKHHTIMGNIR